MKIVFVTRYFWPHVGGVEKHVEEISNVLISKGHKIIIITEQYSEGLKGRELKNGVEVIRFTFPKIKYFGLLNIWWWVFKNRKLFYEADIVHAHDVTLWLLPLKILNPRKALYSTFHGWEGHYPIPLIYKLLKKLAGVISIGTIAVGDYINKWYGVKSDLVTYGGINTAALHSKRYHDSNHGINKSINKVSNSIVFLGRLEEDTGLKQFLRELRIKNLKFNFDFVGDGSLRNECEKHGKVYGFTDPEPFLEKAEYCVPGGYLSALEALSYGCKLKLYWNNPLKEDYWKLSPFYKFANNPNSALKRQKLEVWLKNHSWEKVTDLYLKIWKGINEAV